MQLSLVLFPNISTFFVATITCWLNMTPMLGATSGRSNPNDDSETQDDMRSHKSFIILSMQVKRYKMCNSSGCDVGIRVTTSAGVV